MPHFAASDLGLHCLSMSHKKYARLRWVKQTSNIAILYIRGAYMFHNHIFLYFLWCVFCIAPDLVVGWCLKILTLYLPLATKVVCSCNLNAAIANSMDPG